MNPVLFAGVGLWCVMLLIVSRLLTIASRLPGRRPNAWRVPVLLALLAIPLLFRPHELLLSGQDPGVYINSAAAFARQGSLFYHDELLAEVPVLTRGHFMFGHLGYGPTKDGCLAVQNIEEALIGPRFPFMFPLLLSPLASPACPRLMLFVAPLFALGVALALGVAVARLARRPGAGTLAGCFYLAMPLVIWHARAPRPELVASFLLLSGFVFTLHAWEAPSGRRLVDLLLGACCVALAPFFHITGWFGVVGAAAVLLAWSATGRRDVLLAVPVLAAGVIGYGAQTLFVCDQYGLRRFLTPALAHPWLLAGALLAVAAVPVLACAVARRRRRPANDLAPRGDLAWGWRVLVVVVLIAACAWMVLRTEPVSLRRFSTFTYHYIHPADLRLVGLYLGRAIALLAAAGVLLGLLVRRPGARERLAFVIWLLPAALCIGTMQDFFTTRYLLTATCPLLAAGLALLLTTLLPAPNRRGRALRVALAGAIVLLMVHGRSSMIRVTEYRGLAEFLGDCAGRVQSENGILLAEYARLATPLEHVFGVPLLSLDNETRDDYGPALAAWRDILNRDSSPPGFFLTPFPPPVAAGLTFMPVWSNSFDVVRLSSSHYRLPGGATRAPVSLFLYRVTPDSPPPPPLPYVRTLATAGNMGLTRFTPPRPHDVALEGVQLAAHQATAVAFKEPVALGPDTRLLLFAYTADRPASQSITSTPGSDSSGLRLSIMALADGWSVLDLRGTPNTTCAAINLSSAANVCITDAWRVDGARCDVVELAGRQPGPKLRLATRAARITAQACLPLREGALLALFAGPLDPARDNREVRITRAATAPASIQLPDAGLQWTLCAVNAAKPDADAWELISFTVADAGPEFEQPPFIRVGQLAVLPP